MLKISQWITITKDSTKNFSKPTYSKIYKESKQHKPRNQFFKNYENAKNH